MDEIEKNNGEIIIYRTEDGRTQLEVRLENENVWLSQQQIANLFGVQRPAITKHLRNIFESGELEENSVSSILEHTASDGKNYKTQFYNLDAIISVGYSVNSLQATHFRRWATERLKEYLIKADMSSSSYQAYSMSVINALLVFARQQDLEIEEVFDGIPNYLEIMQKYASADTFMEWLEEQCIRLNANQGRERENKAKGIIEEAKQKIQEEFGDPDIGLEKIAAEVGLTQTYFSSLFKKETGMSFVEYLTDTRMKEAMRLLKETSEKIYVVAQKVGYLESGYFSHVFKKKYGMSPIQCRRQGQ